MTVGKNEAFMDDADDLIFLFSAMVRHHEIVEMRCNDPSTNQN